MRSSYPSSFPLGVLCAWLLVAAALPGTARAQDCNQNGVLDSDDIGVGTSLDCQIDGVPDECQMGSSIDRMLGALTANHGSITALVPNRHDFAYDGGDYFISDGGLDMFDIANILNTNLASQIPYTESAVVSGVDRFGPASRYFTAELPGLFTLVVRGMGTQSFSITGDTGADGNGSIQTGTLSLTYDGAPYTVFVKRTGGTPVPSINHLIIVPGTGAGISHTWGASTNNDRQTLTGLGGVSALYYLLVSRLGGQPLADSDVLAVASRFLQIVAPGSSFDCNLNGAPDECDVTDGLEPDCDGNVVPDACDVASGTHGDCNGNSIPDVCDITTGALDSNGNGVPDPCDPDCNTNGVPDDLDVAGGASDDCNTNLVPDECDLVGGQASDCNGNTVLDVCDVAAGTSADCNINQVPDACDIASGRTPDTNGNGVPDACERDCNTNGTPDSSDISSGTSNDCNTTGVPDECEVGTSLAWIRQNLLNAGSGSIGALIPNVHTILYSGSSYIFTGGGGMYDVGNRLNTNLATNIPYSSAIIASDTRFGAGSRYFTASLPQAFVMVANDISIYNFSITGNVGADGDGFADAAELDFVFGGVPHRAFIKRIYGADDPSVNHIIIVPRPPASATHTWSPDTDDDLHILTGLAGVDRLYYALVSRNGGGYIDDTTILAVAREVLSVLHAGGVTDCNANGLPDECDIDAGTATDCDGSGTPDSCEIVEGVSADCNANGQSDICELVAGTEDDCNLNSVPDLCEIAGGGDGDCNGNTTLDSCEIDAGTLSDLNANRIPDSCEPDCNTNGLPDDLDIAAGAPDCDADEIPDDCQLQSGAATDCDGNDVLDSCDVAAGAFDCNHNNIPDPCELIGNGDLDNNGVIDTCDPDCNGNGLPDGYDVSTGTAPDCNGNGRPDSCDFGSDIRAMRSRLDAGKNTITTLIPNRHDIVYDGGGYFIANGGGGMFATGNILNTDLATQIPYTSGAVISGATTFGPESEYFTAAYPGAFFMAAVAMEVSRFEISGATGSGGLGVLDSTRLSTTYDGDRYSIYIKRVYNTASPSVHHVLIIPGDGGGVTQTFGASTADDLHVLSDLRGTRELYYLLLSSELGGYIGSAQILAVVNRFLAVSMPGLGGNDCNTNGLIDSCEIDAGTSFDCNGTGLPDDCEPDADQDGVPDDCDACAGVDDGLLGNACDSAVDPDPCSTGELGCGAGVTVCSDDAAFDDADGDGIADCQLTCGVDPALIGQPCDSGVDFDDCETGTLECQTGAVHCTDGDAPDDADADGVSDCHDACQGSPDAILSTPCDGDDVDDCVGGVIACDAGDLACDDDAAPDDADGDGVVDCRDTCSGDNRNVGLGCDGPGDADPCPAGAFTCATGVLLCDDDADAEVVEDVDANGVADCLEACAGSIELLGTACDSEVDADICASGRWSCDSDGLSCTDGPEEDDPAADADGDAIPDCSDGCVGDDTFLGEPCDDPVDTDTCAAGVWTCDTGILDCGDDAAYDDLTADLDGDGTNDCLDACDGDDRAIGSPCDSTVDADACAAGILTCASGALTCSDDDAPEIAGVDSDGDGIEDCQDTCHGDDNLRGVPCDSPLDTDACAAGMFTCTTGVLGCSDGPAGDDAGADSDGDGINDCNDTCRGDDAKIGRRCDSPLDADACETGLSTCADGVLRCTDGAAGDAGVDSDGDGIGDCTDACVGDDELLGRLCDGDDADTCNGGIWACSLGTVLCTDGEEEDVTGDTDGDGIDDCIDECDGDDGLVGEPCDGDADADLCEAGTYACDSGVLTCDDDEAAEIDETCSGPPVRGGCTCGAPGSDAGGGSPGWVVLGVLGLAVWGRRRRTAGWR